MEYHTNVHYTSKNQRPAEVEPVVQDVIKTEAFQRLRSVSFMGALDYAFPTALPALARTRFNHSISVAQLAQSVALTRDYPKALREHLVIAALLHDVGHPPLSHSVESAMKDQVGYGHHKAGEFMLDGEVAGSEGLKKILSKRVDTSFLKALIGGKVSAAQGGDLFSAKINIDTIDGIIRASNYGALSNAPALKPHEVAYAALVDQSSSEESTRLLDAFWALKHRVYSEFVHSHTGLAADQYSAEFANENASLLGKSNYFKTEHQWRRLCPQLFQNLNTICIETAKSNGRRSVFSGEYQARKYWVDNSKWGNERYQSSRENRRWKMSVN